MKSRFLPEVMKIIHTPKHIYDWGAQTFKLVSLFLMTKQKEEKKDGSFLEYWSREIRFCLVGLDGCRDGYCCWCVQADGVCWWCVLTGVQYSTMG